MSRNIPVFCLILSVVSTAFGATLGAKIPPNLLATSSATENLTTQSKLTLTLEEAVSLALRNNRAIRSSYLERISQRFDLQVAEDKFNPKGTLSTSYLSHQSTHGNYSSATVTPTATILTMTGAKVSVTWSNNRDNIVDGTRAIGSVMSLTVQQPLLRDAGSNVNFASVRVARINDQLNRLSQKNTVMELVTQTILAYRELLRSQDQLKISKDSLERAKSLVVINDVLINAGRMARVDKLQAEADIANQELAVEEASNQVDAARSSLLNLLALSPSTELIAAEPLITKEATIDIDNALKITFEYQPDYLASLLSIERVKIDHLVAKNQRLWDVSLIAGTAHGRGSTSAIGYLAPSSTRFNDSYAGFQVVIPIGDLSSKQAEIKSAIGLQTEMLRFQDLKQTVEQRVRSAVRDVYTRWRQLQIAQRARALSAQKLEHEREKLKLGRSSNFQVLSFEADLRNSESTHLNATIGYLNALTLLDRQQGTTLNSWKIEITE